MTSIGRWNMRLKEDPVNVDTPSFDSTPEAQEYIQKLQKGRIELDESAASLEREAFKQFKILQQRLGQLTQKQTSTEKQIQSLQTQLSQLSSDVDVVSGQMAAYAQLLVSAEGARRDAVPHKPEDPPATKPNGSDNGNATKKTEAKKTKGRAVARPPAN